LLYGDIYKFSGHNRRVYVYEEGEWSIKGRFQAALEDNDEISWEKEKGEYTLFIAVVSKHIFMFIITMLLRLSRRMKEDPTLWTTILLVDLLNLQHLLCQLLTTELTL
jgi:hypothetical protein